MRIGLDLSAVVDADERMSLAIEADQLGLWAVLIGGEPGTEVIEAATIATGTTSIHLAVLLDVASEHPLTVAEEIAVLDHLSNRRALAIVNRGSQNRIDRFTRLLAGEVVDGVALSPPPAQTLVPVWGAADVARIRLSGDLDDDAVMVDRYRNQDCTHLFVAWPGPVTTLARHLASRAASPDFPSIVAEMADRIAPY